MYRKPRRPSRPSKDTYAFLKTDGTYVYIEKTLNDPKPTQAEVDTAAGADGSLYRQGYH
jgi:hypothetical protein